MCDDDKPLVWLHGEVKSPPFSAAARVETGVLLRRLQQGELLSLPHSRPMPAIAARCHELRIVDEGRTWRVVYRIDPDAIVIAEVFQKVTRETPEPVKQRCRARLRAYDELTKETPWTRTSASVSKPRAGASARRRNSLA
jgi:phage-related protein